MPKAGLKNPNKQTNKQTQRQFFGNISVILLAVLNKKYHGSFIHVLIVSHIFARWLYMQLFFLSRTVSEWRVNEMFDNALSMACNLRLCLHID